MAVIYGVLLLGLFAVPLIEFVDLSQAERQGNVGIACVALVIAMLTAQAGLLFLPVTVMKQRRIVRRSLWPVLLSSGFLVAVLLLGLLAAVYELVRGVDAASDALIALIVISCVTWICWSVAFYLASGKRDPASIGFKLHRHLIKGSILELLIAVPSHIVVRQRTECCAGMYTGFGIAAGVAVMILAFGPSVLILYYKRCTEIRPKPASEQP